MPAFIHTHDRHLDSRILQGQLTNVFYNVTEVETDGQPLYEVGYGGDRYASATSNTLCRTDIRVQTKIQSTITMVRGDSYCTQRHSYHEVIIADQLATSTLVCMHGYLPGAVNVVGLDGYPEKISFKRTECSADYFFDQFET